MFVFVLVAMFLPVFVLPLALMFTIFPVLSALASLAMLFLLLAMLVLVSFAFGRLL
jgi:hypothetical protein